MVLSVIIFGEQFTLKRALALALLTAAMFLAE
jgi:hypothetical protein